MLLTIIIITIVVYLIFKFGLISGQVTSGVNKQGGMRVKYSKLVNHILSAHRDSCVFLETRTYLRVGVSNYGGTTLFHIQQCPDGKVMIQYEIKNNPIIPPFHLDWTFSDSMDQDEMLTTINRDINMKIHQLGLS
jgi:hypothetical protein bacD2_16800